MDTGFDLIVVGMGVAGEEVALRAGDAGMKVLGIEQRLIGGECPYWGCVPSKVMVRAGNSIAEAARALRIAARTTIEPNWEPVAARVREVTGDWDDSAGVKRLHDRKGTFVRAHARLAGPRAIDVDGKRYTARRGVVVATGGEPAIPPIEGLDTVPYWTNREAIETKDVPRSIVVLGAGPIGLELGQVFKRFGSDVTFVEMGEHALPAEEPENGEAMDAMLREEGMALHAGVSAKAVRQEGPDIVVELSDGTSVRGERLLVATGRRLSTQDLGLETIDLDPKAPIPTDEHLRARDGLWACGDVTGKGAFTHVGMYQARIAASDILEQPHAPANYDAIPRVTFTDPEVASVGLSEKQAREQGVKVKTGVGKTTTTSRGWIHGPGAEHGVTKLVADNDRRVLVGGSTMGPSAGEIVAFIGLAIKEQIPIPSLRDFIYPYPTFVRGMEDPLRELG